MGETATEGRGIVVVTKRQDNIVTSKPERVEEVKPSRISDTKFTCFIEKGLRHFIIRNMSERKAGIRKEDEGEENCPFIRISRAFPDARLTSLRISIERKTT